MYYNERTMGRENSEFIKHVKERILYFMDIRKMSFYELSLQSGVTEVCLRNWYSARNYTPSLEAIEKVCTALDIRPFELFCDEQDIMPVDERKREILKSMDALTQEQLSAIIALIKSVTT